MSHIRIRRAHGKSLSEARAAADHLAQELSSEFDMRCAWEENTLRFKRSGIKGTLELDDAEISLVIELGLLFLPMKGVVEQEIHKYFDENFPA